MEIDGQPVDIGGPKPRAVVARLAIAAGQVVSTDALVDTLWGDDPPATAHRTVQAYVSRLRKILGAERLRSVAPGYVLDVGDELDLVHFEALAAETERLAAHDPQRARAAATDALALWRGAPFADAGDVSDLQPTVVRLEELRLATLEHRLGADLALGHDRSVIGELEALLEAHPWREGLWAKLMTALVRSGRQADALRAYQRARRILGDEVGIEPSPELRELEERILLQEPATVQVPVGERAIRGYEVLNRVGTLTTGEVYRATHVSTGRDVALTIVGPEWADDPSFIRTFETGARVLSGVEHPNCASVLDFWREPGSAFLARPWLSGRSLADTGALPDDRAVTVLTAVASALDAAHRQGTVHGRVAADTVWLDAEGHPYLVDFDLAAVAAAARPSFDRRSAQTADVRAFADLAASITGTGPADGSTAAEVLTGVASRLGRAADSLPQATDRNPYKGLRPFGETDAGDFHGRDAAVADLAARLRDRRFLTVVGPSGSGKSSLVRAGLIPALRGGVVHGSEDWLVTVMTPGTDPFQSLAAALLRIADTPPPDFAGALRAGLGATIEASLPVGMETLIVIDQLEELYRQTPPAVAAAFSRLVADTIGARDTAVRIVATLRADAYDGPLEDEHLAAPVRENTVVVAPMATAELTEAVVAPAADVGVSVEPALVARLLADVSDEPGGLPLLQFALTELFAAAQGGPMTLDAYQRMGGLGGSVARAAEGAFAALDASSQEAARNVFLQLVEVTDDGDAARRTASIRGLTAGAPAVGPLIEEYGRRRLLSFDRDAIARDPTVRISHESLMSRWNRLADWTDDARADLALRRRLSSQASEWVASGRDHAFLLHGSRLAAAISLVERRALDIDEETRALVLHSDATARDIEAREQERAAAERRMEVRAARRLRVLVGVFAVAAVVAAALSVFALSQRAEADRQAKTARSETVRAEQEAARAEAETVRAEEEATRAEILSAQARVAATDAQVRSLLANAARLESTDPGLGLVLALEAAALETGSGSALTTETIEVFQALLLAPRPISKITSTRLVQGDSWADISHDGTQIAIGNRADAVFEVWDARTGTLVAEVGADTHVIGTESGAFLSDGALLVTDRLRDLYLYDGSLVDPVRFTPKPPGGFLLAAETSDGTIVTVGADRSVVRWSRAVEAIEVITDATRPTSFIYDVSLADDGTVAIGAAAVEDAVEIFDLATGNTLSTWPADFKRVFAVQRGGAAFVFLEGASTPVAVRDGRLARHDGHSAEVTEAVTITDSGDHAATGDRDGVLRFWDTRTGDTVFAVQAHGGPVLDVLATDDVIATLGLGLGGIEIAVWDTHLSRPRVVDAFEFGRDVKSVQLGPDIRFVAANLAVVDSTRFDVRRLDDGSLAHRRRTTAGVYEADPTGPDTFAVLVEDGGVIVVDNTLTMHAGTESLSVSASFAPRGSGDGVNLAPPDRGAIYNAEAPPGVGPLVLTWCCSGSQLALVDRTPLAAFVQPHTRTSAGLIWYEWSASGDSIVLLNDRNEVLVYQVAESDQPTLTEGRVVTVAEGRPIEGTGRQGLPVADAAFHPTEPHLAIATGQGTIEVWDLSPVLDGAPCENERVTGCGALLHSHRTGSRGLTNVIYDHAGTSLITGDTTGDVSVWNPATWELVMTLRLGSAIVALHVLDGDHVLAVTESGVAHTLTIDPDEILEIAADRADRVPTAEECERYGLNCD